jgi:transketolase
MSADNLKTIIYDNNHLTPQRIRQKVLEMAFSGSTVHIACAFSLIEILTVLYRSHLRYPGNNPRSEGRDYLVLSKGHGVMAQYACMHEIGWLSDDQIKGYHQDGSALMGLSEAHIPGIEVNSGSLGHGFSVGVGIALGLSLKETDQRVYAIIGDGEMNEGTIWEGALMAAHHQLDNFMLIVDKNGMQAMGATEEILSLGNLAAKLEGFGFELIELDGHNEYLIDRAINTLWSKGKGKPKALIANTIKGKGVSFMENNNSWHYKRLDAETFAAAIEELTSFEKLK